MDDEICTCGNEDCTGCGDENPYEHIESLEQSLAAREGELAVLVATCIRPSHQKTYTRRCILCGHLMLPDADYHEEDCPLTDPAAFAAARDRKLIEPLQAINVQLAAALDAAYDEVPEEDRPVVELVLDERDAAQQAQGRWEGWEMCVKAAEENAQPINVDYESALASDGAEGKCSHPNWLEGSDGRVTCADPSCEEDISAEELERAASDGAEEVAKPPKTCGHLMCNCPEAAQADAEQEEPECRYCRGLKRWSGDAPLPAPLRLGDTGLASAHCGYEGAPSPRFSFVCPGCGSKP